MARFFRLSLSVSTIGIFPNNFESEKLLPSMKFAKCLLNYIRFNGPSVCSEGRVTINAFSFDFTCLVPRAMQIRQSTMKQPVFNK